MTSHRIDVDTIIGACITFFEREKYIILSKVVYIFPLKNIIHAPACMDMTLLRIMCLVGSKVQKIIRTLFLGKSCDVVVVIFSYYVWYFTKLWRCGLSGPVPMPVVGNLFWQLKYVRLFSSKFLIFTICSKTERTMAQLLP